MAVKKGEKPDILAVARAARVSASTVSRTFNHPELVKASTRRKIDNAVRRLGYIRNRAAQTIHGIRSATIGLIVPTIDQAIFAEVVQAFSDAIGEKGFTVLLATHGYDLDREYEVLRKLLEHRVDGVALIGSEHATATYDLIAQQEIPAVAIWNYDPGSKIPTVGASNLDAGRMITGHLLEQGHRNIALLFPPLAGNDRAGQRFQAVRAELATAKIDVPDHWIVESPYSVSAAKSRALEILTQPNRPDVILCGNDVLAIGVINAARALGLTVPDDISVSGIGDFKAYQDLEPALTTVRLPARRIGRLGGDAIVRAIGEPSQPRDHIECQPELIIRDSVAPML